MIRHASVPISASLSSFPSGWTRISVLSAVPFRPSLIAHLGLGLFIGVVDPFSL